MSKRIIKIALHVNYNLEENTTEADTAIMVSTNFPEMIELWKEREKFDMFIILACLKDVSVGLPSLKNYCLTNSKFLMVDTHICSQPDCKENLPVSVVKVEKINGQLTAVDRDSDYQIVPKEEKRTVVLELYMYNSLLSMAKMELKSLEHEGIPLIYCDEKLVSIYKNIQYMPNN